MDRRLNVQSLCGEAMGEPGSIPWQPAARPTRWAAALAGRGRALHQIPPDLDDDIPVYMWWRS